MNLDTIAKWIKEAVTDVFPTKEMGVLLGQRPTDYVAGKVGAIQYKVRNPSGDWRNFVVRGEKQWYPNFDTFACTAYANNNSAEIQLKYLTGVELNFSDRALSVLAENTQQGNYLYKPADIGRKLGRILEQDWPDDAGDPKSWQEYNKPVSEDVLKKRVRFKEEYEWIDPSRASIEYHLKQAPILIVIGYGQALHNVVCVHSDAQGLWYFDSYDPWLKVTTQLPKSALKLIVTPVTNTLLVRKGTEWGFFLPATSEPALIDKAINLGYLLPTTDNGTKVDWPNIKPDIIV